MARPPQYAYPEHDSFALTKVKAMVKELTPEARAFLIAWLIKFYRDDGQMFSPQVSHRRKRLSIDDETFWLVKIPNR